MGWPLRGTDPYCTTTFISSISMSDIDAEASIRRTAPLAGLIHALPSQWIGYSRPSILIAENERDPALARKAILPFASLTSNSKRSLKSGWKISINIGNPLVRSKDSGLLVDF